MYVCAEIQDNPNTYMYVCAEIQEQYWENTFSPKFLNVLQGIYCAYG